MKFYNRNSSLKTRATRLLYNYIRTIIDETFTFFYKIFFQSDQIRLSKFYLRENFYFLPRDFLLFLLSSFFSSVRYSCSSHKIIQSCVNFYIRNWNKNKKNFFEIIFFIIIFNVNRTADPELLKIKFHSLVLNSTLKKNKLTMKNNNENLTWLQNYIIILCNNR